MDEVILAALVFFEKSGGVMARRPAVAGTDLFADLAKKTAILERELAAQRVALERLKALGETRRTDLEVEKPHRPYVAFDGL
jgi:hypothetical protein